MSVHATKPSLSRYSVPANFLLLISFFLLTSCKNDSPEFTPSQWEERRVWIGSIIKDNESIENGVTREYILTMFQEEGGISTRTARTFTHRTSLYINTSKFT